jgi:flagellum-specific peptidoglycan hydrolase FlgJ
MANEVIINIPGIGDVVAENAATEATLRDILAAINSNGGIRGGGAGNTGGGSNAPAAQTQSTMLKMASTMAGLTNSLVKMSISAGGLINKFAQLDGSVNSAAYEVRSLAKDIPIVGGLLNEFGNSLTAVARAQTDLIGSYQKATASGATFAGSVNAFAANASAASMTLSDYAQFVASNGEALRALGGNTEEGARRFGILSKALQNSSSDLYSLGFSTKDLNDGLAKYSLNQQYLGNLGKKSNTDLIAGTKAYLKELDILAKITGQTRDQKADELNKLNVDVQFRAFVDSLGERGEIAGGALSSALSSVGPTMNGFIKDMVTAGVPTTEQNATMFHAFSQTATQAAEFGRALKDSNVSQDQLEKMKQRMLETAAAEARAYKQGEGAIQVFGAGLDSLTTASGEMAKYEANARKAAADAQDPVVQKTNLLIDAYSKFQTQVTEVGNKFTTVLANSGIFDLLIMAFTNITKFIDKVSVPAFDALGKMVQKATNWINASLVPIFDKLLGLVDYIPSIMQAAFGPLTTFVENTVKGWGDKLTGSFDGMNISTEELAKTIAESLSIAVDNLYIGMKELWVGVQMGANRVLYFVGTLDQATDQVILWGKQLINSFQELAGVDSEHLFGELKIGFKTLSLWFTTQLDSLGTTFASFQLGMLNVVKMVDHALYLIGNIDVKEYTRRSTRTDAHIAEIEKGSFSEQQIADAAKHKADYEKQKGLWDAIRVLDGDIIKTKMATKNEELKQAQKALDDAKKNNAPAEAKLNESYAKLKGELGELQNEMQRLDATRAEAISNLKPSSAVSEYEKTAGSISSQASAANSMAGKGAVSGSQSAYYNKMYNAIHADAVKRGLPNPEVIAKLGAAQTSLESGYGTRLVGNNAFGIKGVGPAGSTNAMTTEYVNGKPVRMMQQFKKFNDVAESATGYLDFLLQNKRYKGVLASTNIEEAIARQGQTGYATSPTYAAELSKINAVMSRSGNPTTPVSKSVNTSALNDIAAANKAKQDNAEEEARTRQFRAETALAEEKADADKKAFTDKLSSTSPLSDPATAFDQLLQETRTSNQLLTELLSTNERHVSIAQGQSGNLYAQ